DRDFAEHGADRPSELRQLSSELGCMLAAALSAALVNARAAVVAAISNPQYAPRAATSSTCTGGAPGGAWHALAGRAGMLARALARQVSPQAVVMRVPEGYAYYALYPQLYVRAAQRLRCSFSGALRLIGIRTIGSSLAPAAWAGGGKLAVDLPVSI